MVNNASFMVIFPLTFVANTFVPLETLLGPLQTFAEWNPVSAVTAAARDLFGNSDPDRGSRADRVAAAEPRLYTIIWSAVILLIFIPLANAQYRKATSRDAPITPTGSAGARPDWVGVVNWRDLDAVLLDLDGVITPTAEVHMRAWNDMFNDFLSGYGGSMRDRSPYTDADYFAYVDGKPRYAGVRDFLGSRGILLPEGSPEDAPSAETVSGLGNRKNDAFNAVLARDGVAAFPGTLHLLDHLHEPRHAARGGVLVGQRDSGARGRRHRRPLRHRRGRQGRDRDGAARQAGTRHVPARGRASLGAPPSGWR